ncbi:MAG: hypothetical protein ABSG57_04970 [Candidatus Bathyarchaeia archaeon]|jgi:hypothetical protein
MKTRLEVTEKFVIIHSRNHDDFSSQCGKIEHEVSARFEIEIPAEVIALLQNLRQSGKLDLIISLEGQRMIDLRDKEQKSPFISDGSNVVKGKNILQRIVAWVL